MILFLLCCSAREFHLCSCENLCLGMKQLLLNMVTVLLEYIDLLINFLYKYLAKPTSYIIIMLALCLMLLATYLCLKICWHNRWVPISEPREL